MSALGRRLLVSTDHEGGRIVMLGRGATIFPDNLAVGTAGEEAFAARQGLIEGREMRRLGVDLTLGPCLDVLTDRYSPNIGIRSYGKDPKLVSRYGVARIRGQMRGRALRLPQALPGQGPLAARRASEAAHDRLDAGGDARRSICRHFARRSPPGSSA